MVFSSITFVMFFLVIVLVLYYNPIFKSRKFKNILLLLASLGFYAWGEPYFVFAMMASIVVNWLAGLGIAKCEGKRKKTLLVLALVFDFAMLFVFKYLGFTCRNLSLLFHTDIAVDIALPLGISFYTFQIVSYIIDLYRGKISVQKNVLNLGLYISMFAQLMQGPIVRYETVENELENRQENWQDFSEGLMRFVYGLAKKVIIANSVAQLADKAFASPELSVLGAWLGAIAYTLQIYFDFSGYSDMALGLGRMFGFHYDENFNYPYISSSVTEFWRRWHISLSTWFRDYVYIPLGGSRVKTGRHIFNLFVVWAFTGLWHGANWTFVLWGLVYFAAQVLEKYALKSRVPKWIGHIYTMLIVICCWVLFRSESIGAAGTYLARMFGVGAVYFSDAVALKWFSDYGAFLALGMVLSMPLKMWLEKSTEKLPRNADRAICTACVYFKPIAVAAVFVLCIAFMPSTNYNPFIYFNF